MSFHFSFRHFRKEQTILSAPYQFPHGIQFSSPLHAFSQN